MIKLGGPRVRGAKFEPGSVIGAKRGAVRVMGDKFGRVGGRERFGGGKFRGGKFRGDSLVVGGVSIAGTVSSSSSLMRHMSSSLLDFSGGKPSNALNAKSVIKVP